MRFCRAGPYARGDSGSDDEPQKHPKYCDDPRHGAAGHVWQASIGVPDTPHHTRNEAPVELPDVEERAHDPAIWIPGARFTVMRRGAVSPSVRPRPTWCRRSQPNPSTSLALTLTIRSLGLAGEVAPLRRSRPPSIGRRSRTGAPSVEPDPSVLREDPPRDVRDLPGVAVEVVEDAGVAPPGLDFGGPSDGRSGCLGLAHDRVDFLPRPDIVGELDATQPPESCTQQSSASFWRFQSPRTMPFIWKR